MTGENRVTPRLMVVDALCVTALTLVATSPFADVWAGRIWLVAVLLGLAVGLGSIALARALHYGPLLTALLLACGYLLVGPAAAAPSQAIARVLPSLDALKTVVLGVVRSWRSVLTLPVPLGSDRGELVVPFLTVLIGAALVGAFLWRSRLPGLAFVGILGVFVVAASFGARDAELPVLRGVLLVVGLLVWLRWRSLRHVATSWVRRTGLAVALLAISVPVGWGLTAAVAGSGDREVLREHVEPPLAELDFKSPLARYRDFYKAQKDDVLFRFERLPALEDGRALVRLATMDSFDGLVWNVTTEDLATGSSAFRPAPASRDGQAIEVTVDQYSGPWVPSIGTAQAATLEHDAAPGTARELLINTATGGLAEYGDVRSGDTFRVDWAPSPDPDQAASASIDSSVELPEMTAPAIERLDTMAQKWVGSANSDLERVEAIAQAFHDRGYFNDGLAPADFGYSQAGHGTRRLVDLTADEKRMVGNDEQYASAMAYVAQRLGIPARVVLGFEKVNKDGTVTGDDIAAWVEVPFEGVGWVPFDPTPPEDQTPPPTQDADNPMPQPYVVQPPVIPDEPDDVQGAAPEGAGKDLSDRFWDVLLVVLKVLWWIVKIALWLSPLWLVLLVKWLRKRRRRLAGDPLARLRGGWREIADQARDLGARIPAGHTRHESSVVLAGHFGEAAPIALATQADRHVFGPVVPSDDEVAAYWADVDTALREMRRSQPWWRRIWAILSPVSLPWRRLGTFIRSTAGSAVEAGAGAVDRSRAAVAGRWAARKQRSNA